MDVSDLLTDALGRVREQLPDVVKGLSDDDLAWRPDPEANSIAWLVWHLTRIEDDHVAGAAGTEQVWTAGGWAERFDLPFSRGEHGYGMHSGDVGKVRVSGDLLAGYYDAVAARSAGRSRPRRPARCSKATAVRAADGRTFRAGARSPSHWRAASATDASARTAFADGSTAARPPASRRTLASDLSRWA